MLLSSWVFSWLTPVMLNSCSISFRRSSSYFSSSSCSGVRTSCFCAMIRKWFYGFSKRCVDSASFNPATCPHWCLCLAAPLMPLFARFLSRLPSPRTLWCGYDLVSIFLTSYFIL